MDIGSFDKDAELSRRIYDSTVCFLCGRLLEEFGSTEEHIFPRWVQKRFDLWNQKLTLLNGTTIPYRSLTVPCCEECNKYRLQPIEVAMSAAMAKGAEEVRALGNNVLFLWLGKIFYAILYKELSLSSERKKINSGAMVPEEVIRGYESHLFFLQAARGKVETKDFCPGSIFVFRTQSHNQVAFQWDYCDNIDTLFMGVRMGEVGIIGVLADGGAQQLFSDFCEPIQDFPLHPIQFRELCAVFSYQSTLATRTPKYITKIGTPHEVYQLPLGGMSTRPLFNDWDFDKYAKFLAYYTDMPLGQIRPETGKIMTYLYDPDNKPVFIPFE
jgi:hypothetical protein